MQPYENSGYGQPPQHQQQQHHHMGDLTSGFNQMNLRETISNHVPHIHRPQFLSSDGPGEVVCGPLLRYISIDYSKRVYHGSILVVTTSHHPPPLEVNIAGQQTIRPHGQKLDSYRNKYHFFRYALALPIAEATQEVTYSTPDNNWAQPSFSFHMPSIFDSMRFMFYSCNGFSDIPQDIKDKFGEKTAPLWQDVLDRHDVLPFHVLLGGGDQLYQDRLIKEDFMKPWNDEKDPAKRLAMPMSNEMRSGFEQFYFDNYVINFG
jgi:hypothetical protein